MEQRRQGMQTDEPQSVQAQRSKRKPTARVLPVALLAATLVAACIIVSYVSLTRNGERGSGGSGAISAEGSGITPVISRTNTTSTTGTTGAAPTTDPKEMLARAAKAEADPEVFGLHSYHGLSISPSGLDQFPAQTWFQSPAHKRVQVSNGPTFFFDGDRAWMLEQGRVTLIDASRWGGPATGFLHIPFSLRDAIPTFAGKDQVAGRSAYILRLSAGPSAPVPPPGEKDSPFRAARVWFDAEFYIPLKIELINGSRMAEMTWAFTSFDPNPNVDQALFAFALPPDAEVEYERAPDATETDLLWQRLASKLPYMVFELGTLPGWLSAPGGPSLDYIHGGWVGQSYYDKNPSQDSTGLLSGLTLIEMARPRPTSDASRVANGLPDGSTVAVQLANSTAQYGEKDQTRWLVFELEGTKIWLEGQGKITRDELVTIANSMRKVQPLAPATHVTVATIPLPIATAQALATAQSLAADQHFGEGDLEFIDAQHGWYLPDRCPDAQEGDCARQIMATTDGGETWRAAGITPKHTSHIRFANAADGWVYGPDLYVTHDGGTSWVVSKVVPGNPNSVVTSLEWLGGNLDALVQSCIPDPANVGVTCTTTLHISTDQGASWQQVTSLPDGYRPGGLLGRMSLKPNSPNAQRGWLTSQDALLVTHDGGRTWQARAPLPCSQEQQGYSPLLASDGGQSQGLWAVCGSQPGAGSQLKSVYRSSDEGLHWQLVSGGGYGSNEREPQVGDVPVGGYLNSLAVSSPERAWLSLQRGTLYGTADGGRHWQEAVPMPGDGSVGEVLFADIKHGWWLTVGELYRTVDGGDSWERLRHP